MKKTIILLICTGLLLTFTACAPKQEVTKQDNAANENVINEETNFNENNEVIFGKVKNITGNEIDLSLGNIPMDEYVEGGSPNVVKEFAGVTGDVVVTTAASVVVGEGSAGDAETPKMELEYTGENKSFNIPAGIPITDIMGSEKQLQDLKKGSVLSLVVDKKTNAVSQISILE